MNYLVTGAAGFIGSHLSKRYSTPDSNVYGLDSFSSYYSTELKFKRVKDIENSHPNFKFIQADLADLEFDLDFLLQDVKFDAIFHLAAQPGVRLPRDKHQIYLRDNVVAFERLMQSCIKHKIPKFFYASSSSVYGNDSFAKQMSEEYKLDSQQSFYGLTKFMNEQQAKLAMISSDTKAIGLRFFTVYGPSGRPDMAYFKILKSLLLQEKFVLYGDGSVSRDFTYISDVIESIASLDRWLDSIRSGTHEIFNIGGGNARSMQELINICENTAEKKLEFTRANSEASDMKYTRADFRKLERTTSFKPSVNLEHGIKETFAWMNENLDLVKRIK